MAEKSNGNKTTRYSDIVDRRNFLKAGSAAGLAITAGYVGNNSTQNNVLRIGASAALTGKYAKEGEAMKEGYELWINQVNEEGGALEDSSGQGLIGYDEVELFIYDDESDPSRAVKLYQRLFNEDNVDLVMGPYSSAVSTSVIPIIERERVPAVFPLMSDTSVLEERDVKYVVQSIAPAGVYTKGAIDIAAENGAETLAVAYEDTAFPTAAAEGHLPYAREKGFEIVHNEAFPKDINDYTPILNKVKDSGADVFLIGGYLPDAVNATKAAKSVDYEPEIFAFLGQATTQPEYREAVQDDALAIGGSLFWAPWFNTPYNEKFVEDFMEMFSDAYDEPDDIDPHSPGGWTGCLVMEQALKNVGELDKAAIAEELRELDMGVPYGNGRYEVNEQGVQVGQAPSLSQWHEGDDGLTLEVVWPGEYKTADPIYPHPGWG